MKTKIEIPDFISEQVENFYKEDQLEKEKASKLAEKKAKRAARNMQVGSHKLLKEVK